MKFQEIIEELKTSLNLTQTEIAKKLGTGQKTISHWERGEQLPSYELLQKLCEVFELAPDYVLGFSEDGSQPVSKISRNTKKAPEVAEMDEIEREIFDICRKVHPYYKKNILIGARIVAQTPGATDLDAEQPSYTLNYTKRKE